MNDLEQWKQDLENYYRNLFFMDPKHKDDWQEAARQAALSQYQAELLKRQTSVNLPEVTVTASNPTKTVATESDWDPGYTKFMSGERYYADQGHKNYLDMQRNDYTRGIREATDKWGKGIGLGMTAAAALPFVVQAAPVIANGIKAFRAAHPIFSGLIDTGLTIDGIRNALSDNGVKKTINYAKDGNWGKAAASGAMDLLDLSGGLELISDAIKGYKYIKHISNPKSVLDWSFNSWFNLNGRANADLYDKVSLLKHLPEYVDIELLSKANGTWLQMNDGTMFKGDPREWVMMQSKAFKNSGLGETQVMSGDWTHRIPNTSDYNVWGVTDKDIYKAYNFGTDGFGRTTVYKYVYPKKSHILEINLPKEGIYWGQIPKLYIPAKSNLYPNQSILSADDIVEGSKNNGFDIIRINNVIEGTPGNNPVDDIIIHANTPRKIILGSNGNFNMRGKNPFKIVVPGLIATGIAAEVDAKKSGGTIKIKKENKGKFTASAKAAGEGVQEHAHKVMNDPNATPLQKKRANFAIQAKKWHRKHQLGGKINYLNYFTK